MGKFDLEDGINDFDGLPGLGGDTPSSPAANDADETPRPPDLTESGLGQEVETSLAIRNAKPGRVKPDGASTRDGCGWARW